MIYSNYEFLLFLPVIVAWFYFLRSRSGQTTFLIVVSAIFLAWTNVWNLAPAAFVLVIGYCFFKLDRRFGFDWRLLSCTVTLLVLNLAWLKYRGFLAGMVGLSLPVAGALIPLGISFYSFEAISAVLDVHRRRGSVRPTTWVLFIMFFPHLIAGPIVRLRMLGHQFESAKRFTERNLYVGLHLFTVGFIKKLGADPLGQLVDPVWSAPAQASSLALGLAVVGFSAQLFLDFSGYTDMARGIARMLGYRLPVNFRAPLYARNPGDFYQRWHVSLSSWIRAFVYDTLAVAVLRRVRRRQYQQWALVGVVLVVMALFGLWHGAAWHFVLFGVAQGCVIAGWDLATRGRKPRSRAGLIAGMLLLQLTWLASLVFFRANTVHDAGRVFGGLVRGGDWTKPGLGWCLVAFGAMMLIQAVDFSVRRRPVASVLRALRGTRRGAAFVALVFFLALSFKVQADYRLTGTDRSTAGGQTFIYFRF